MGAKPCKAAKGEGKAVRPDDPGKKIPPTIARVALKELYFSIGQITLVVCSKRLGLKLLGFVSYFEKLTHFSDQFFLQFL